MIRNQKIKGNFIPEPLFFKWIPIFVRLFFNWSMSIYSNYILFIFSSLCVLVSTCYNFSVLFLHTLEKKCTMGVPLHFFQVSQIWIISSRDINLQYTSKVYCREWSDATEKDSFGTTFFFKKVLPRIFFKFCVTEVLFILGHISNKVNKGIVRSRRLVVFCKKGFFRKFTKFTAKHLCQCLFFNKVFKKQTPF